jgi:hypothetical protein
MKIKLITMQIGALLLQGSLSPTPDAAAEPVAGYVSVSVANRCKGDNCPNMPEKVAAEEKAKDWLDRLLKSGFTLQTTNASAEYEDKLQKWAGGRTARVINIHAYAGEWPTTLHFKMPVNASMSVKEIQARIKSFSHDGFPTPGLSIANWRIRAYTPTSHAGEGIEILEVAPGHLKFRVRTQFFMLYGLDQRMRRIQDAATPPEAFFAIKQSFMGQATVTYKIANF